MKEMLDGSNKKNPFQAPEGYFDGLGDRIMDRIGSEERDEAHVISLGSRGRYAAAAAVVLLAIFFLLRNEDSDGSTSAKEMLAGVSDEAIVEYLAYTEITSSEILDQMQFTMSDADSLEWDGMMEIEPDNIDLLIQEYSLIDLDSNAL